MVTWGLTPSRTKATTPALPATKNAPDWPRYRALLRTLTDPVITGTNRAAWLTYAAIAWAAFAIRVWRLGIPDTLVFDESYYVKQAYSLTAHGVELRNDPALADTVNATFESGTPDVFTAAGDLVVHPPLGKWLIGIGQTLGGVENPWAWRIMLAVAGALTVLIVARAARRLTGSFAWGAVAGILLAVEGTSIVHSRTGILDGFLALFGAAAFAALLADRDQARETLAYRMSRATHQLTFGPRIGTRPWRWAAGIMLGCAAATKWSGLYLLVGFGLLTVLWDLSARRRAGIRWWPAAGVLRDGIYAFIQLVGTTAAVYVASWAGWFATQNGYNRQWAATQPEPTGWVAHVPDALRSWWQYHQEILAFHTTLASPHPYQSAPWTWPFQIHPTLFYLRTSEEGSNGCPAGAGRCYETVTSMGTIPIWWAAVAATLALTLVWAWRRNWQAGAILAALAASYGPWFFLADRTVYAFYTVAFAPFAVLAIVHALNVWAGNRAGPLLADTPDRTIRWYGAWAVASILMVAAIAWLVWFYPVYTAQMLDEAAYHARFRWTP